MSDRDAHVAPNTLLSFLCGRSQLKLISNSSSCKIHSCLRMLHPMVLILVVVVLTVTTSALVALAQQQQWQRKILPGTSLHASAPYQTWSSVNATFSLGFVPSDPPTDPPSLVASIAYSGGVPVWSVGNGVLVDSGGSLRFLTRGNLCLVNGSGAILWESGTAGVGVAFATLEESGNLVLWNSSSDAVWSSFENPTDTLLPEQGFKAGELLRSGRYSFTMLPTGNLTLRWNNTVVYWNHGVNSSVDVNPWNNVVKGYNPRLVNLLVNLRSPSLELQAVGILAISDPMLSSPVIMAYSSDFAEGTDVLRFLKLGEDGNMRIYSSERGSGTAVARWAAVQDQCQVFGYCGNLGICFHSDLDQQDNPRCECPSANFKPVDPKDARKGCKRKVELENCLGNSTMLELNHMRFSDYRREHAEGNDSRVFELTSSSCVLNCLKSNVCAASASADDGTRTCYSRSSDFFGGYRVSALPGTLYIKVCGHGLPNPVLSTNSLHEKAKFLGLDPSLLVIVTVPSVVGFVIFQLGFLLWYRCSSSGNGRSLAGYKLLEYVSSVPVQFSYKELERSTKGFEDRVGAGESGAVYRGVIATQNVVAVKRLNESNLGEIDFRKKVSTICSTHHLNLVRIIGYCFQKSERLLVYEFMKNGSLDSFLFQAEDRNSKTCLSWERRFNVVLGSAKGIAYLHEECRECIIHSSIKPENILLDENYNAKVSDFGLAGLIHPCCNQSQGLASVLQTRSYVAPERLANLPITSKADVYSFGMVLLEIVGGRRNYEVSAETAGLRFSAWVHEEFEKGNLLSILDGRLAKCDVNPEQVHRVVITALWCIGKQPSQRPTMGRVVQMLEGHLEVKRPPPPPPPEAVREFS